MGIFNVGKWDKNKNKIVICLFSFVFGFSFSSVFLGDGVALFGVAFFFFG